MIVFQEQFRGLDIVLLGGDVKRRQMNFSTGVVLQENSDDLVVTLL